jgi:hypothetical protein
MNEANQTTATDAIDDAVARLLRLEPRDLTHGSAEEDEEMFRRRRRDAFFEKKSQRWWQALSQKLGRPSCEEESPSDHFRWNRAWQSLKHTLVSEENRGPILLLTGRTRTGKTLLATGLGLRQIRRNRKVSYNTWMRIGLEFEEAMKPESERSRRDVLDALCAPGLFILDEISAGLDSEANARLFRQFITEREGACRPTILISNHSLAEISRFLPETVMSRIEHSDAVIDFDWDRLDQAEPGPQ